MAKRAVVLAGGGSRGAYQIGVWKALRQLGITYDIVTGSSVGALNGALMVQDDFDAGLKLWENISSQDVMTDILTEENLDPLDAPTVWRTFIMDVLEKGGCDITPLENTLRRLLDEPRFRSSPIEYALVTVEYPTLKPLELTKEQIPQGQVCDYLLASSACFPAFKPKEINGTKYLDGGYHDNLPVNLAQKLGAEEIIAVDLQSIGVMRKPKLPPGQITMIRSHWNLGPFILFDATYARRNIALGYLDGQKAFGKLSGWKYAFLPEDCQQNAQQLLPVFLTTMVDARKQNLTLVNTLESMLYRNILKALSLLEIEEENVTLGRVLLLLAEYAGEIFRIEPTVVYPFSDFHEQLLAQFQKVRKDADFSFQGWSSIPKIIDELKQHDRMFIAAYLYEQLKELFTKDGKPRNLPLFVPAFPEELLAAFYLLLLERRYVPYQWPALF